MHCSYQPYAPANRRNKPGDAMAWRVRLGDNTQPARPHPRAMGWHATCSFLVLCYRIASRSPRKPRRKSSALSSVAFASKACSAFQSSRRVWSSSFTGAEAVGIVSRCRTRELAWASEACCLRPSGGFSPDGLRLAVAKAPDQTAVLAPARRDSDEGALPGRRPRRPRQLDRATALWYPYLKKGNY